MSDALAAGTAAPLLSACTGDNSSFDIAAAIAVYYLFRVRGVGIGGLLAKFKKSKKN